MLRIDTNINGTFPVFVSKTFLIIVTYIIRFFKVL